MFLCYNITIKETKRGESMSSLFNYKKFNIALIVFLSLLALLYAFLLLPALASTSLEKIGAAFKIIDATDWLALVLMCIFLIASIVRLFNARNNTIRVICVLIFIYFAVVAVLNACRLEGISGLPYAIISVAISFLALKTSR